MKIMHCAPLAVVLCSQLVSYNAQAEDNWVTLYGKINVALDKIHEEAGDKQWEVNSYASRIGVKGKGSAGDGFEAFYQLEWEVDVADNAKDNIKSRNQVVGVRGDFGEVFIGEC